jgi:ABC-type sugar transport system ATPase subunit
MQACAALPKSRSRAEGKTPMASVTLDNVQKDFNGTKVLHGIDLQIDDGEFVVFVGPSGCGKSTLLRLICGLDDASAGQIAIDGEIVNDVPPAKRGIAMVFQSYALYPHMSVADNMGYALRLAGTPRAEIDRRVGAAAAVLRLDALLARKPRQLSGGQRQRVAIGRAIVREPRIFLFDEPLSNLDAALRVDMRAEIASLKRRLGTTMIYVTHDQIEAMTLADKIVVMHAGRVEQVGSPLDLYRRPANRFVATFIGSPRMNLVAAHSDGQGRVQLADKTPVPMRAAASLAGLEIGLRAEHIRICDAGEAADFTGTVQTLEHHGADIFAHILLPGSDAKLVVRQSGDSALALGNSVPLAVDWSQTHLFGSDGTRLELVAA